MTRRSSNGSVGLGFLLFLFIMLAFTGFVWVLVNYTVVTLIGVALIVIWWKWYFRGVV